MVNIVFSQAKDAPRASTAAILQLKQSTYSGQITEHHMCTKHVKTRQIWKKIALLYYTRQLSSKATDSVLKIANAALHPL
eukprot:3086-Heterococcus_DN1.PRE.1